MGSEWTFLGFITGLMLLGQFRWLAATCLASKSSNFTKLSTYINTLQKLYCDTPKEKEKQHPTKPRSLVVSVFGSSVSHCILWGQKPMRKPYTRSLEEASVHQVRAALAGPCCKFFIRKSIGLCNFESHNGVLEIHNSWSNHRSEVNLAIFWIFARVWDWEWNDPNSVYWTIEFFEFYATGTLKALVWQHLFILYACLLHWVLCDPQP